MGSGTVLVEALVLGRSSWGVDVNPVAVTIAQAKTEAHEPRALKQAVKDVLRRLEPPYPSPLVPEEHKERLAWWFPEHNITKLGILNQLISQESKSFESFFRCALSSILKRCSLWSPDSIKPIRSERRHRKKVVDPFAAFRQQLELMQRGNRDLWIKTRRRPEVDAVAALGDARRLESLSESVDLVVTSPPYVTAYDCTEVFELSLLWLFAGPLRNLRRAVIGTRIVGRNPTLPEDASTTPWGSAVLELFVKDRRSAVAADRYYRDMELAFSEAARVLRPGGRLVVVAGDGALRGVTLANSRLFPKMLDAAGLRLSYSACRPIGERSLPPVRDRDSGRFLKTPGPNSTTVYPTENILVFHKPRRTKRHG